MKNILVKQARQKSTPKQKKQVLADVGTKAFVEKKPKHDIEMKKTVKK